jgi:hypothetical protein
MIDFIRAGLRRGPRGLADLVTGPLMPGAGPALPPGHNLILLVDQFEEIFRYRRVGDTKEADAFVAMLVATTRQTDVPVFVAITMRSDYLGDCAVFEGLPELLNDSQFLTPRLSREQRQEAIEGPARVFGGEVEPGLVGRLLNDMGPDPDQLPLMQHALTRLWDLAEAEADGGPIVLKLKDYAAMGGLNRALHNHAEEVFDKRLTHSQKRVAEVLFRCLSERERGGRDAVRRDIRRPTLLCDIASVARASEEDLAAVIDVFREPELCFLTPPAFVPLSGSTMIDVSHESLIRRWGRLQEWVEDEAELAKTYLRYEQSARLWKRGETGLLAPPELDFAMQWLNSPLTTDVWARRYEGDFALAEEYVRASEAQHQRQQEAERARELARQEAEKRELLERERARHERELEKREQLQRDRYNRRLLAGAGVALLCMAGFASWAWYQREKADRATARANAERQQLEAVVQQLEAVVQQVRTGVLGIIREVPREVNEETKKTLPLGGFAVQKYLMGYTATISSALQEKVIHQAIESYSAILSNHQNLQILSGRSALYRELGRIQCRKPSFDLAEQSFRQALSDQTTVFQDDPARDIPQGLDSRRDLSQSYTDLAELLEAQGRTSEAKAADADRTALWSDPKDERLEKARELASWLISDVPGNDQRASRAVQALKEAIARGQTELHLRDDESFKPLRDREDFRRLITTHAR